MAVKGLVINGFWALKNIENTIIFNFNKLMIYAKLTAAEAAAMIQNDETVALSGFTPNGVAKAVFRELSKRALHEHAEGRPFKVGIITGASTGQSVEGDMAAANAIKFRTPFSTNKDFREHVNAGEIDFEDMHLGHVAERLRRGFYGEIDWAIIEVSGFMQAGSTCRVQVAWFQRLFAWPNM